jgi:thioredoxin 1
MQHQTVARTLKSAEEWDEALRKSSKPVVLEFRVTWCPYCQQASSVYEALAAKYRRDAEFYVIDGADAPQLFDTNRIETVPTFHLYGSNKKLKKVVVSCNKKDIEDSIRKWLLA